MTVHLTHRTADPSLSAIIAAFVLDSDYPVTQVLVGPPSALGVTLDRSLNWTGDGNIGDIAKESRTTALG